LGGGKANGHTVRGELTGAQRWSALQPHVGAGAVFRISDLLVKPSTGSTQAHPYVIIGGIPPRNDKPRIALARPVQIVCRHSFRPEEHGPRPQTLNEEFDFGRAAGRVFSSQADLDAFDSDGVFQPYRYSIQVSDLEAATFLDWLPLERLNTLPHYPPDRYEQH
jgi:hypothetical protein